MQVDVQVQRSIERWEDESSLSSLSSSDVIEQVGLIADERWQRWFHQWLSCLQPSISPIQAYDLGLLLTNDAGIQTLNATYRHQDRPTDVLAFAILDLANQPTHLWAEMPVELGDIIISVETAARQAVAQNHSLPQELAWLATHGLLHLLGWDHPNAERLEQMLAQQETLLHLINLPQVAG